MGLTHSRQVSISGGMQNKIIAEILLKAHAVSLNPKSPFTYASGIKSPIYCDNRSLIGLPEERNAVISGFLKLITEKNYNCDVVAGTATAGIPWAAWIADRLGKPMIYVRSSAKEHGKGNQIEGQLSKGDRVLLIEDLISTGGSSVAAVRAIQESGNPVIGCVAIFTYQMKKAEQAFAEVNVTPETLSDFSTLVQVACDLKLMADDQKQIVLEWNKDPQGWGKKYGFDK